MGLMGVEAYYPAHSEADVEKFVGIAKGMGLWLRRAAITMGAMRPMLRLPVRKEQDRTFEESLEILTENMQYD